MIEHGAQAPKFKLAALDGEHYSLDNQLTLAIFFKTSCPTCQYAWQFYERLYQSYKDAGLQIWGISQHNADKTRKFKNKYGATFPHLLDEGLHISEQYDPEFVPTLFLIDENGTIVERLASWHSAQLNQLSERIAAHLQVPPQEIVEPQDNAIPFKPG